MSNNIIKTEFNFLDKVQIKELETTATVMKIQFTPLGILYLVEYWWNGEIKTVWLHETELTHLQQQKELPEKSAPFDRISKVIYKLPFLKLNAYQKGYVMEFVEYMSIEIIDHCGDDQLNTEFIDFLSK